MYRLMQWALVHCRKLVTEPDSLAALEKLLFQKPNILDPGSQAQHLMLRSHHLGPLNQRGKEPNMANWLVSISIIGVY